MSLKSLADRARRIVSRTLSAELDDDPEVDRMAVGDAVVSRDGDHYRIESGDEPVEQLDHPELREMGICDCGSTLSRADDRLICRSCGREFT